MRLNSGNDQRVLLELAAVRQVALCALLSSPLMGCGTGTPEIEPLFPTPSHGTSLCLAETASSYEAVVGSNRLAGHDVEILSTGASPLYENLYRWQVTGAPGREDDDSIGRAFASYADIDTGVLEPSLGADVVLIPPAPVGSYYQFGWSLLSADVRECHSGATSGRHDGCGQEILVGAPDTSVHTTGGRVYYFKSNGDDVGGMLQYGGQLTRPAGLSLDAEFGYSITAYTVVANADEPWLVAGTHVPWVAVGAPGVDMVYIYSVDPSLANPFTLVQSIAAPLSGHGFGHSLVAADFDDDGYADLAIGAPYETTSDNNGYVWTYRGQLGVSPLQSSALLSSGYNLGADPSDAAHFGWSMDAGPFVAAHSGDSLIIGAPLLGTKDNGGFCQQVMRKGFTGFYVDATLSDCWSNNFLSSFSNTDEHLGWAVSTGNFHNADSLGDSESTKAGHPEVAVSRPGYDNDRGAVNVFATVDSGVDSDHFWAWIEEWSGPHLGSRFGASIATGYVHESNWEDLAIGAPSHLNGTSKDGTASLTFAVPNSPPVGVTGYWEFDDVTGGASSAKIWTQDTPASETRILFTSPFSVVYYEDYQGPNERVCTYEATDGNIYDAVFEIPKGTSLVLPAAWDSLDVNKSWSDVVFDEVAAVMVDEDWASMVGCTVDVEMTAIDSDTAEPGPEELFVELSDYVPSVSGVDISMEAALIAAKFDDPANCEPVSSEFSLSVLVRGVCE